MQPTGIPGALRGKRTLNSEHLRSNRRIAYIVSERMVVAGGKGAALLLAAHYGGPAVVATYVVSLATATLLAALANFGRDLRVQSSLPAMARGARARLVQDHTAMCTVSGILAMLVAGGVSSAMSHNQGGSVLSIGMTSLLTFVTVRTQFLSAISYGLGDFRGHLFGNAAQHVLLALSILLLGITGAITGELAVVSLIFGTQICNTIWWQRTKNHLGPLRRIQRFPGRMLLESPGEAAFTIGSIGAARADLLVVSFVASPAFTGAYALSKQLCDLTMYVPRMAAPIILHDAAANAGNTRARLLRKVAVPSTIQAAALAPFFVAPAWIMGVAGGNEFHFGSSLLPPLAIASGIWGISLNVLHADLGLGHRSSGGRWAIGTSFLLVVATVTHLSLGGEPSGVAWLVAGAYGVMFGYVLRRAVARL